MKSETLRERRARATREHVLAAALERLVEHPDEPFSHEAVARAAGVGARTVYRYFATQADLYEALWLVLRERSGTVFPKAEGEILSQLAALYRGFDANEKLVRAVMASPAGARIRAQGAAEGRASFDASLQGVLRGRSEVERRQIRSVFQGLHSGLFWQMLRDRGELTSEEAIAAATWAAATLLEVLRAGNQKISKKSETKHQRKEHL